jgi:hypothetical protein
VAHICPRENRGKRGGDIFVSLPPSGAYFIALKSRPYGFKEITFGLRPSGKIFYCPCQHMNNLSA